jgi:serine/threonine protein kinase
MLIFTMSWVFVISFLFFQEFAYSADLPTLPKPFVINSSLSFIPQSFLGVGQFGTVYLCHSSIDNTTLVAVKEARLDLKGDNAERGFKAQAHIKNEVSILQQFSDSPYIVRMLDYSIAEVQNETSFLVLEYMVAGDLFSLLFESRSDLIWRGMTERTRSHIFIHLVRVVENMHKGL